MVSAFVTFAEWERLLRQNFEGSTPEGGIRLLIDLHLVPIYHRRDRTSEVLHLRSDLDAWADVLRNYTFSEDDFQHLTLFDYGPLRVLRLGSGARVEFTQSEIINPYMSPLLRRLATLANHEHSGILQVELPLIQVGAPYHCAINTETHLTTTSQPLLAYAQQAVRRIAEVEQVGANNFARSANYLGTKRALVSFLVESVQHVLPPEGIVLDLMCGSGAAAAAFSRNWHTVASDAQVFSRVLARAQGGGYSEQRASTLLEEITPVIRLHASQLGSCIAGYLTAEDEILYNDSNAETLQSFQRLGEVFPLYPEGSPAEGWNPVSEVQARRNSPRLSPYCLFTAYFSNVYFGIRQCVEIDSIRFAIEQLKDDQDRTWALGALVTTLSEVGTTYAAHFAQPPVHPGRSISLAKLSKVQEQRSRSVLHEFSIRLLQLGRQSGEAVREIPTLAGPWQSAVNTFHSHVGTRPALVYLDAPYQRDEYSRYYHVLETLVSYLYPASMGSGRTPERGAGPRHRFASEFGTRTETKIAQTLIEIIESILMRGWICAWSYADNGVADMVAVVEAVCNKVSCHVQSFSTPFTHNPLGSGRAAKRVVEYLIIFTPA